eukprot:gene7653-9413_t
MNEFTTKVNTLISKFIDPNLTSSSLNGNSNWCSQVEKKSNSIITQIPSLESSFQINNDEKRKDKIQSCFQKLHSILQEYCTLLEITNYKPSNKLENSINGITTSNNNDKLNGTTTTTTTSSSSATNTNNSNNNSPSTSYASLSSSLTSSSTTPTPTTTNSTNNTFKRTQSTENGLISAITIIKENNNNNNNNINNSNGSHSPKLTRLITHSCRESMLTVWGIAKQILEALTPPETEITDIKHYFPCPPHLSHLNIIGERPDRLPFYTKETVFFVFFKDWFIQSKFIMSGGGGGSQVDDIDMKTIPGFFTLTYALLHEIKTRDQAAPPLSKPTPSLEAQYCLISNCRGGAYNGSPVGSDSTIIDTMVKIIFLKTCVFDLAVVSTTLSLVEAWFKEYGPLPESFDINFFCEGIDNIIAADHHQVVIRALQLIYNTSDCFQGHIRKVLFADLLLYKYFYPLFLHWDQPVRNAYHHLLLYKMVRIKRSILYKEGFTIGEFSKLTHNNTVTTKNSLSPTKYPEKDHHHDSIHSMSNYGCSSRLTNSTPLSIKFEQPQNNTTSKQPKSPRLLALNNNQSSTTTIKKVPPPVPPRNFLSQSPSTSPPTNDDDSVLLPQPPQLPIMDLSINENDHHHQQQQQQQNLGSPRFNLVKQDSLEKFSKEYSIDLELFLEIEIYIKKVSDQLRQPELKYHDPRLSHYVANSLSEFKTYIALNNQTDATPPKIIPLMLTNSPLNPNVFRD